jgi:hypothetical protein
MNACATGGQAAAKDAMKRFAAEHGIKSCNQCHTKLAPTYELKSDGFAQFAKITGKPLKEIPAAVLNTPSLHQVDWAPIYKAIYKPPYDLGAPSVEEVVYGDLDGDAIAEAVVRVFIPDAKMQQLDVYTSRKNGPLKIGQINGGWRSAGGVESVQIRDGFIFVERSQLAEGDCMACASLRSRERWSWDGKKLVEDVGFRKTWKPH